MHIDGCTGAVEVPYTLLVELAKVAPAENAVEYVSKRLIDYRAVKEVDESIKQRIEYALRWAKEYSLRETEVHLNEKERKVILDLSPKLVGASDQQAIQALIFETARANGLEPSDLFKILYRVLLGVERGPRLGPYISDVGPSKVAEKLMHVANLPSS